MKRFLIPFIGLIAVGAVIAADELASVTVTNKVATTNTVYFVSGVTTQKFNGFIDSIYIKPNGAVTTGAVILTSLRTSETLLSATYTAASVIRPRVAVQNTSGVTTTSGTNALERIKLVEEGLSISVAETAPVTNTYTIYLKLSEN